MGPDRAAGVTRLLPLADSGGVNASDGQGRAVLYSRDRHITANEG
jgi:hypothetical protein